jgi:hypothetical protein
MSALQLLDAAGRRRSPATLPGFHARRPPRNKGFRYVGVDPVLVIQVDAVGAEPLEGALDGGADVRRAAVEHSGASARMRDEAELRRHHDLLAAVFEGAADEFLVRVGAVDLGGVDIGDTQVERRWMVRIDSASLLLGSR